MLYGYGDDKNPYTETVDFLEDLVMEFISEMTHKSMEIGRQGRVQVDIAIEINNKVNTLRGSPQSLSYCKCVIK